MEKEPNTIESSREEKLKSLNDHLFLSGDGIKLLLSDEWGFSEADKEKVRPTAEQFLEVVEQLREKLRELKELK